MKVLFANNLSEETIKYIRKIADNIDVNTYSCEMAWDDHTQELHEN